MFRWILIRHKKGELTEINQERAASLPRNPSSSRTWTRLHGCFVLGAFQHQEPSLDSPYALSITITGYVFMASADPCLRRCYWNLYSSTSAATKNGGSLMMANICLCHA
ncbi:hypothetical protein FALCPG4_006617 [Fusarium falciforme]